VRLVQRRWNQSEDERHLSALSQPMLVSTASSITSLQTPHTSSSPSCLATSDMLLAW